MTTPAPGPPRPSARLDGPRPPLARRLGVGLVALLVAPLLAEGAHRAWRRASGEPYDRAAVEAALLRAVDTTAAFVPGADEPGEERAAPAPGDGGILHPFYGSERQHDTGGVLGFFRREKDRGAYTVLVVGGSVAAAWAREGAEELRRRLEADPRVGGRPVRILRFAHAAYKQPQQLARVSFLLSHGHRPDAVINLDGFNEVALGVQNMLRGASPLYPAPNLWEALMRDRRDVLVEELDALLGLRELRDAAGRLARTALDRRLTASSLLGTLALRRMDALAAERAAAEEAFLQLRIRGSTGEAALRQRLGPAPPETVEEALELSLDSWFESSLSLDAMCAERGIDYLHCLQPALFDAGSKPRSAEEAALSPGAQGWRVAVELGYPRLRERGAELAARGVRFLDASRVFAEVEETLYFDACHFVPAGNRILGAAIADAFLAAYPSAR